MPVVALFLTVVLPGVAQTAAKAGPGLPKDPREVFAAAAPFYDFTSPELKPWHLKASYQLYDEKGNPAEQGSYEYWWASPQVYRSTWTRPGVTHTDWHTADGKHMFAAPSGRLRYFERDLELALFSPLPAKAALESSNVRLSLEERPTKTKGVSFPCISLVSAKQDQVQKLSPMFSPTYCFDPKMPVLRDSISMGMITTEFNSIIAFQGRYLAKEILVFGAGRKFLAAKVDSIGWLDTNDPALTPSPDAAQVKIEMSKIGPRVEAGHLVKKQAPIYPLVAKENGQQGAVLVGATIGVDGKVHNPEIIFAPSALLGAAALEAVSQWEYSPYLLNGQPVQVETTINVFFSLGR